MFKYCIRLIVFILFTALINQTYAKSTEIVVFASKSCGCCHKWVKHLQSNGFKVKTKLLDDVYMVKEKFKIPEHLQSCHTAIIDGYIVEGHVPVAAIRKLISSHPAIRGISVPGMPVGSPGMEQGSEKEPYNVVSFTEKNKESIFMKM